MTQIVKNTASDSTVIHKKLIIKKVKKKKNGKCTRLYGVNLIGHDVDHRKRRSGWSTEQIERNKKK